MKKALVNLFVLGLALGACSPEVSNYSKIQQKASAPAALKERRIESWKLENGLEIRFVENNEFPLVEGTLYLRGGTLWEAPGKLAQVSAMGEQMRMGGAGPFGPDALDEKLDRLSASVGSSYGTEYGNVGFSCLESDLDEIFSVFSDVVLNPHFDRSRLDLWKGQAIEGIRRRKDDPETVGVIALKELLFGDTPYGRVTVEADIQKISADELKKLHATYVRPQGAVLAVTGRVKKEKLDQLVRKYFEEWTGSAPVSSFTPPPVNFVPQPGIYFINQPLEQATIYIGQQGVKRLSPDYLAIDAFNQMFGAGDFSALLTRRVRSELGLAYGVYGAIMPGVVKGKNFIGLQTKAESTGEAILESVRVLEEMQRKPADSQELKDTVRGISQSFVFNFDSLGKILNRKVQFEILGYPPDFDETYLPGIQALTPENIQEVAERRWDTRNLIIVVVGNDTAWQSLEKMLGAEAKVRSPFAGLKVREVTFTQKLEL